MSHVNARLTVHGRRLIVDRVAAGRPVAHIAAELGVSRQTAYRWVRRFWTSGKAERFNRTLQTEWAYRQIFTSSNERQDTLAPWLRHYNTERIHTGIGTTPINRVSPTS